MRDLRVVINQMLEEIPVEEKSLRAELLDIADSDSYAAPEAHYIWGQQATRVLVGEFGPVPPTEGWKGRVLDIWMDRQKGSSK